MIAEEEEEEPLHIVNQNAPNDDTISTCLIGKLWTDRSFNTYGLMETMKKIWNPAKGVVCRELGKNMISFQFKSKKDMNRVLAMEPWHFNKHVLVLKSITTDTHPSAMEFNTVPFWIRIYDLPFSGRNESTVRQIGGRFGEVIEIDNDTITGIARSVRVKILLKIDKPLKRGTKVMIGSGATTWLPITYERLPSFCYMCGLLGHLYKECHQSHDNEEKEEIIDEEALPYGDWMRASPMKIMRDSIHKDGDSRDELRRALFTQKKESLKETDVIRRKDEKAITNETNQISDLLDSLQKVGVNEAKASVSSRNNEMGHENQELVNTKQEPVDKMMKPKEQVHTSKHHISHNVLHPTTKTLSPNTFNYPPIIQNEKLTPFSELVKLANPNYLNTSSPHIHETTHHNSPPVHPPTNTSPHPIPPLSKPNVSPVPGLNIHSPGDKNPPSTQTRLWKRRASAPNRKQGESIVVGIKRKEDENDRSSNPSDGRKKSKETSVEIIDTTAEAVVQPRRSS